MAEASEHLTHPVFGRLGWLPEFSHWFTQLPLPSGGQLDVIVDPGDGDRFEFLPRAADLSRRAMANERRVLADAMRAELLELYNDTWRQGDKPAAAGLRLLEFNVSPVAAAGGLFLFGGGGTADGRSFRPAVPGYC